MSTYSPPVAERDRGFDLMMFADQLDHVTRILPERVERYGVSAEELGAIKERFVRWAAAIRSSA